MLSDDPQVTVIKWDILRICERDCNLQYLFNFYKMSIYEARKPREAIKAYVKDYLTDT